tara:strand:- start:4233 stop:4454 length:222 start_codon:yes stop_codon:yes gene_type:complete
MPENSAKKRNYQKCLRGCEKKIKNNNDRESQEALGQCKIGCMKKFTSEPIPHYIMRALQPKKSVHPVYGKLRY